MAHWFHGTESAGVELFGTMPLARAQSLVRSPIAFEEVEGARVRASILAIYIEKLGVGPIPVIRFTYPEVLWLLHVRSPPAVARIAVRAQSSPRMYLGLAFFDRYDTTFAKIRIDPPLPTGSLNVRSARSELSVRYTAREDAVPPVIERLWTRAGNGIVYEIPWSPNAPERTQRVEHQIVDRSLVDEVFGADFEIEPNALYYWNRAHACSPAIRVRDR